MLRKNELVHIVNQILIQTRSTRDKNGVLKYTNDEIAKEVVTTLLSHIQR